MSDKWPTGNLESQLRAWAPLVSSGYECPAAGRAMTEAADTITALRGEVERLCALLSLGGADDLTELLALLMAFPCESAIEQKPRETAVVMCPVPQIKPPAVPPWWRPGITEEPYSVKIERPKAVPKYSYPAKKKPKKAKRKGKRA